MTEIKKKKPVTWFRIIMPRKSDIWIYGATMMLALYGTIMIASASMGLQVGDSSYLLKTVLKQVVFVTMGYLGMVFLANNFKISGLRSGMFPSLIMAEGLALLACRLFKPTGNSYAWIRLPLPGIEMTIQPSEFAKIFAILIVAGYCGDISKRYQLDRDFLKKPLFLILVYIGIVLLIQKDFGSAFVIFIVSCVCFLIPQHPNLTKFRVFLKVAFWCSLFATVIILSPVGAMLIEKLPFAEYQKARFYAIYNPFGDYYNTTYQLAKGLVSFATGGWFGVGFGKSVSKYTDFGAANTDYILAILVEELGYVGFLVLMALYGIILYKLLDYARKIRSERAKIILVGTAMYLLVHMVLNIGGVTGMIPLTGVPLLMISAGGSSTLSFMAAIGISQAVIRAYRNKEIE